MLSSANIRAALTLSKDLIADQTYDGFNKKLNTAGIAFDAVEGLGQAANNSSLIVVNLGGFANQRITSDMKWVAPTLAAGYEIGCIARALTLDTNASYYYARCDGDVAKLTKVVAGVFTNISTNAFVLPINTVVNVVLQCVGNTHTAIFTAAGVPGSPLTLSGVDASIPSGGLMGLRSLTSSVWWRNFLAEEL